MGLQAGCGWLDGGCPRLCGRSGQQEKEGAPRIQPSPRLEPVCGAVCVGGGGGGGG